jgi:hypothetical protein
MLLGDLAPDELEAFIQQMLEDNTVDRIIAEEADVNTITFSVVLSPDDQLEPLRQAELTQNVEEFLRRIQQHGEQHSGYAVLTVSTGDPDLRMVANAYEGEHPR